jgi:hypothetical protein
MRNKESLGCIVSERPRWQERVPRVPVGEGRVSMESKRVDVFANMSDEELEAYVNGDRGLEH